MKNAFIIMAYIMAIGGSVICFTNENNLGWWFYGLFIMFSSFAFNHLSKKQTCSESETK